MKLQGMKGAKREEGKTWVYLKSGQASKNGPEPVSFKRQYHTGKLNKLKRKEASEDLLILLRFFPLYR